MTDGPSWRGNWPARLNERVRELGYSSLTAFAESRPTASLVELAEVLGQGDIAGVQVFRGLVEEAERAHQVTRLVRSQFVRELSEGLPHGWPPVLDDETRMDVALVLGSWFGFTPVTHQARVRQANAELFAHPPPAGWRPLGPDDELLRTLLPDEEA